MATLREQKVFAETEMLAPGIDVVIAQLQDAEARAAALQAEVDELRGARDALAQQGSRAWARQELERATAENKRLARELKVRFAFDHALCW